MYFTQYHANQKTYEAQLMKIFIAHALHPDQIAGCFVDEPQHCAKISSYLRTVVQNVNGIANKIISNAHCRVVNLLANDGKDGVLFLDLQQLNQRMFSDFCPDNPVSVVSRLNESWHRSLQEPVMVRLSTKQYPIGSNSSPLEEIDEAAERIFNVNMFNSSIPSGRATKPLTKNKGKGRGLPGAAAREEPQASSRGNWLAFPPCKAPEPVATPSPIASYHEDFVRDEEMLQDFEEPQIDRDLRTIEYATDHFCHTASSSSSAHDNAEGSSTRLEDLFDKYGPSAPDIDRAETSETSEDDAVVRKVAALRSRLIPDHKRRLTERWGNPSQTLRRVLPSIKQILAGIMAAGYRPTTDDYRDKARIIEARERRHAAPPPRVQRTLPVMCSGVQHATSQTPPHAPVARDAVEDATTAKKQHTKVLRKRQKMSANIKDTKSIGHSKKKPTKAGPTKKNGAKQTVKPSVVTSPPAPDSSGSTTLDIHQDLPPDAYFEPHVPFEKPAWRCGIKHAMGYYYNAGNRTSCPGCFTHIKDNMKTKHMDFYLPTSTYFFRPAPDIIWTPSKPMGKARRSKHLSHNSIAKEAYWKAFHAGATAEEARKAGVEAVETALRPKTPKDPTPEPTPEPEPDLGPHPSGSATMEHGQDIPECAYFDKIEEHESFAWRCDVNHALGRYYLTGDKRTCPGCGSNRNGVAKQLEMDFYMPPGVVVRQEARSLSLWKPRKPYKLHKPSSSKSARLNHLTHNQNASKKYHEAIDAGHEHGEAVRLAVQEVEAELDAKQDAAEKAQHTSNSEESEDTGSPDSETTEERRDSATTSQSGKYQHRRSLRNGDTLDVAPKKRKSEELSEDGNEDEECDVYETEDADVERDIIYVMSSDDEESSGSDSE
jgi:hypothetical protein